MAGTSVKRYHLSLQQARLWSLQEQEPQHYTTQCAIRLTGQLDLSRFLQAIEQVVMRQSVLRTSFVHLPGLEFPLQAIHEQAAFDWTLIDVEQLPHQTQEAAWPLDSCPFHLADPQDLTKPSLLQILLLRISPTEHQLYMRLPALCADEPTLLRFVSEWCQAYATSRDGAQEDEEEPLDYTNASAWQDELLQEDDAEEHRNYWRRIDLTEIASNPLPVPYRGSQVAQTSTFSPQALDIPVEASLWLEIRRIAATLQVSQSTYVLACWYVSCLKLMQTPAMVMGLACDSRFYEELESALGLYQRVVPLTLPLAVGVPFEQVLLLLEEASITTREEHFYFSWEESQSNLPDKAHRPYLPVSFVAESWPASLAAGTVTCSLLHASSCTEPFALKVGMRQIGEQVQLTLHYDAAQVNAQQAQALGTILSTMLAHTAAQPRCSVEELSLLNNTQRLEALRSFRAPQRDWSARRLQHLFEEQVRQRPDAPAVYSRHESLSYAQLNARANQLAHVLRKRGVSSNTVIGLCCTRQATMLVGLLGILKAGGAYLPLEANHPAERLSYQLQESQALLLLTQRAICPQIPQWNGPILTLEDVQEELIQSSQENPIIEEIEEALASIIYTSGSTGRPKGVMVRQSSVANYTLALCTQLGVEPGWQYATVSTLAADLGNTAIFCALASGGCVQIIDEATLTSGDALATWARQHPIDVLKIVPSHLSALLESERAPQFLPICALILGGEILSEQLVVRIRQIGGHCRIYNHYGPTETTIGVLLGPVTESGDGGPLTARASIALGHPIINTQTYVLDSHLQIVPAGMAGELFVGGAGVAWGYVGQSGLTAESFVPDPYNETPGARLYRTGDLVRYDASGKIEFVGRNDGQIKLRGYRIEIGEVEAALRAHPQIRASLVQLYRPLGEEPRLIGYFVSRQGVRLTRELLHAWLEQQLPAYMLPSAYVQLDEFPLTTNGKVDRKQLPTSEEGLDHHLRERILPHNPFEEMMAQIWEDLLGRAKIGVSDNFFELGGHSLLATRVIARVCAQFQVTLSVYDLFTAPTVAELTQLLQRLLQQGEENAPPPLSLGVRPANIPLSFAQQRLWFLDQLEPASTTYLQPRAFRLQGPLAVRALAGSVQELMKRHESLRTHFPQRDGQPVQIIQTIAATVLPIIDLQGLEPAVREKEAHHLAHQEAQQPCDLAQGPLLRIALLRLGREEHILLLTLHHIITDGWSNQILVQDLTTLYRTLAKGEPSPLAPLPIQYADYAIWQREWLQGEPLEKLLQYWQCQLAPPLPTLNVPTDYVRTSLQTSQGETSAFTCPPSFAQELGTLGRQEGATLFMVLLAAFAVLLHYQSGQDDLVIGTDIANRNQFKTEGLIGFFVNQLVLRIDLAGNPDFREIVRRIQEVALKAYTHQDMPFDRLVDALNPERDLSRTPLFQAKFVLQNAHKAQPSIPDIEIQPLDFAPDTSKFDLLLNMVESGSELHGWLEYRTDLFKAETITHFLQHFETIIQQVLTLPEIHLEALEAQLAAEDSAQRAVQEQALQQMGLQKLKQTRRKTTQRVN